MMSRSAFLLLASACFLPLSAQLNQAAFKVAFSNAVAADDFAQQQDLVQKAAPNAVTGTFMEIEVEWAEASLQDAAGPGVATAQKILEQLATVVSITPPKTDFLLKRFAWLRELSDEKKRAKVDLYRAIGDTFPKYEAVTKSRSEMVAREIMPQYHDILAKAIAADDTYWATQACWYLAELHGLIPEWYESVYWWKKAHAFSMEGHPAQELSKMGLDIKANKAAETGKVKLDLVDTNLPIEESKSKYQEALTNVVVQVPGVADTAGAPGAATKLVQPPGPIPTQHTAAREWKDVPAKVSKLTADPPYALPSFLANAPWFFWFGVALKRGEVKTAQMLPGAPDLENDGGKVMLHPDGKGKTKDPMRLKLSGKPEVEEFKNIKYLDGTTGTVWHNMLQVPSTYTINGFSFTGGELLQVMYRGASVARGKYGDVDVVLHDINGNGAFNDFGMDAIAIGKGRNLKAQPLSKYVTVEGLFFEITVDPNGRMMRFKPYDGPIAPLRLEYVGKTKPKALIAKGTGEDDAYYYDLMEAFDHPIWVIPGTHMFNEGFIAEGKGDRAQTIRITRGRSGPITIEAAKENVWKMGGAGDGFRFVFEVHTEGNEVIVPAKTVGILGGFGEGYERSLFEPVIPTVQIRKGKDGPIVVTEKMRKCERGDLTAHNDTDLMWYPKTLTIKKTWTGDYQARMEADYPPLGEIKSDWVTGN